MPKAESTTVRVSKKTKTRLQRIATLTGLGLSKTLDFAVEAAEEKVEGYRGDVESLLRLKPAESGFHITSEKVDEVLAEEPLER